MPELIYVDSSNIEAIGYDDNASELHVRFLNGGYYIYHEISRETYDELMAAPSKGSYLNRQIKGVYNYSKQ